MAKEQSRDQQGPRGKTPHGTIVEVLEDKGCDIVMVRRVSDGDIFPCHLHVLTGITERDQQAIEALALQHQLT